MARAMLPLQLLTKRFQPRLPQDVVELTRAFAFIEPEVWQRPVVASLVPIVGSADERVANFEMNRPRCTKV